MDTRDRAQAPNPSQPAVDPGPKASDEQAPLQPEYDDIDEAVEETMIASDPPSFTPHTTIGPPRRAGSAQDRRD